MITYLGLVLFAICISVYVQKRESKIGLILLILVISLAAGFRDYTVEQIQSIIIVSLIIILMEVAFTFEKWYS